MTYAYTAAIVMSVRESFEREYRHLHATLRHRSAERMTEAADFSLRLSPA